MFIFCILVEFILMVTTIILSIIIAYKNWKKLGKTAKKEPLIGFYWGRPDATKN